MFGRIATKKSGAKEPRGGAFASLAALRTAAGTPPASNGNTRGPAVASAKRPGAHPLAAALAEGGIAPYRAKFDDFLPQNEELSHRRHSPFASLIIYLIAALVIVIVGWMAVSKLDSVATAPGVIRPAGKVKLVNHPEGGRVTKLLVTDGSEVKENDVLLELQSELVEQEIVKSRSQYLALTAEVARLEAETSDKPPDFPPEIMADTAIFNNAISLSRARQDEIKSRRAAADSQIDQARSQLNAYQSQVKALSEQVPLLVRRERDLGTLAEQGYYSRIQHLEARRQLIETQGRFAQVQQQLKQSEQGLAEAMERRTIVDREWNSANYKRLVDAKSERDRAQAAFAQQTQIRKNLVIRAPIDGIVNGLKIAGPGQVIRPGDPVLGIVPAAEARKIELEARVSNNDIGMIKPGQRVVVKMQTYDWIRYGSIDGTVSLISADATSPAADPATAGNSAAAAAAAQPFFIVLVALDKDYLGDNAKRTRILPGMTATADFHVGESTVLRYFTDRLFRGVGESLHER